jgi:DNA-binding CsgD family transcriptional regulator
MDEQVTALSGRDQRRLLLALQHLLALDVSELDLALNAAAQRIAEVMQADKVDVFLYDPAVELLVAVGTNDSPMARKQKALGLDRLPTTGGGTSSYVFQRGQSRLSRHLDQDEIELRGIVEDLGVRSQIGVPLEVRGQRHGVIMVCSAQREYFDEGDVHFLEAIANWVGLVGYRAAAVEEKIATAAREGLRLAAEEAVGKLTPRQQEVARLVASGLTNMEIAERLVLTPGTVANHVEGILRRLGYRSRSQVAALIGHPTAAERPERSVEP